MPFKSKAQRRKFAQLLVEGKIAPEVYEEWNQETGRATLPERVKKKNKKKTTTTTTTATRKKRKTTRSRRAPAKKRSGAPRSNAKRKATRKR
jgi:hypothetical protein